MKKPTTTKNPNAVALGKLGGRKGGLAKVPKGIAMATPERRAEIGRAGGLAKAANRAKRDEETNEAQD